MQDPVVPLFPTMLLYFLNYAWEDWKVAFSQFRVEKLGRSWNLRNCLVRWARGSAPGKSRQARVYFGIRWVLQQNRTFNKEQKNDLKTDENLSKNGLRWSESSKLVKNGPKCFNNGSKMAQNGPKVDHQVDLSAKGSYIITHIGLRAEGAKADSQKHKLDDQQIQLISPIMFPIMFPLFKLFHVANYDQLCS